MAGWCDELGERVVGDRQSREEPATPTVPQRCAKCPNSMRSRSSVRRDCAIRFAAARQRSRSRMGVTRAAGISGH